MPATRSPPPPTTSSTLAAGNQDGRGGPSSPESTTGTIPTKPVPLYLMDTSGITPPAAVESIFEEGPQPRARVPAPKARPVASRPTDPVPQQLYEREADVETFTRACLALLTWRGALDAAARGLVESTGGKWADLRLEEQSRMRLAALGAINGLVQFVSTNTPK